MRTRTIRTSCAAAVGLAMLATIGLTASPGAAAEAATATIAVDLANPGGRLPSDLVGLSFEMRELGIGNLDARKGNMVQLFKTLGRSNVRISGNTLDRDGIWLPDGQALPSPQPDWLQHVVTPSDIKRLDEFLGATGWKTEVGINLGRWDAAAAADQARVMTRCSARSWSPPSAATSPISGWARDSGPPGSRTPITARISRRARPRSARTSRWPARTPPRPARPGRRAWPATSPGSAW